MYVSHGYDPLLITPASMPKFGSSVILIHSKELFHYDHQQPGEFLQEYVFLRGNYCNSH